jgi:hypothetical protein
MLHGNDLSSFSAVAESSLTAARRIGLNNPELSS